MNCCVKRTSFLHDTKSSSSTLTLNYTIVLLTCIANRFSWAFRRTDSISPTAKPIRRFISSIGIRTIKRPSKEFFHKFFSIFSTIYNGQLKSYKVKEMLVSEKWVHSCKTVEHKCRQSPFRLTSLRMYAAATLESKKRTNGWLTDYSMSMGSNNRRC